MADQTIQHTEEMVGAGHATKSDTLNRALLIEHGNDGKHTFSSTSLVDDAEITLDTAKTGRGWAMAGDNEEYIEFRFTAAGVVTVITNTANAINTDTDGNLCVYDAGTGIAIKNRLGATKTIRYVVQYSA